MSTFYRQFEEKYRGPREEIRRRVEQYRPLLEWLRTRSSEALAIDLGCGRGEFLDLAADLGFATIGVDLDAEMLSDTIAAGHKVLIADCNAFLRGQPTSAAALITAFHLVEHLSFEDLRDLVAEAYRVLAPGGVLLLETPNPENLTVGGHTFWLDPTHVRPLPPGLLRFVVEYAGFDPSNVLRVNEDSARAKRRTVLGDLLTGVSPDYCVIGMKPDGSLPAEISLLFFEERGYSPERIAGDAEARLSAAEASHSEHYTSLRALEADTEALRVREEERARELQALAEESRSAHNQHDSALRALEAAIGALRAREDERERQLAALLDERTEFMGRAHAAEAAVAQYRSSTSWRITAPLRATKYFASFVVAGATAWILLKPGSRPRRMGPQLAERLSSIPSTIWIHVRSTFFGKVVRSVFARAPGLAMRLRKFHVSRVARMAARRAGLAGVPTEHKSKSLSPPRPHISQLTVKIILERTEHELASSKHGGEAI